MVEIRYSVKLRAVFTAGNPGLLNTVAPTTVLPLPVSSMYWNVLLLSTTITSNFTAEILMQHSYVSTWFMTFSASYTSVENSCYTFFGNVNRCSRVRVKNMKKETI